MMNSMAVNVTYNAVTLLTLWRANSLWGGGALLFRLPLVTPAIWPILFLMGQVQ